MRQSVENFDFNCFNEDGKDNSIAHVDAKIKELAEALDHKNVLKETNCYPFQCSGKLQMTEKSYGAVSKSDLANVEEKDSRETDP